MCSQLQWKHHSAEMKLYLGFQGTTVVLLYVLFHPWRAYFTFLLTILHSRPYILDFLFIKSALMKVTSLKYIQFTQHQQHVCG